MSGITDGLATIGVITMQPDKLEDTLNAYLEHLQYNLEDATLEEITIGGLQSLLRTASRNAYIDDDDEVMGAFGIDKITGRYGRGIEYGDNIIEPRSREAVSRMAQRYLLQEPFLPELERIYAGPASSKCYGHPVHYMIQTDDSDTRRETYRLLLQALHANHRIRSRRYSFVDFRPGGDFSAMAPMHTVREALTKPSIN